MRQLLHINDSVLVVIDVQGKLAQLVYEQEQVIQNIRRLILGVRLLNIPVLWLEQNPDGLGPTTPAVAELLADKKPIIKNTFSGCGCNAFVSALQGLGRRQLVISGIESHICVYQTVSNLIVLGYAAHVIVDAVSSRTRANKEIGIHKMHARGAELSSTETVLYELIKTSEDIRFREMLKIIK